MHQRRFDKVALYIGSIIASIYIVLAIITSFSCVLGLHQRTVEVLF